MSSSPDRSLPPIVILAGGLATRLRPFTERIPKSLLDVNGEPFLAHQLRLLRSRGLAHVILCLGHHAEAIERFVHEWRSPGLRIEICRDGPAPLGTGGAAKRGLSVAGQASFVLYGDSYLPCDYRAVNETFQRSGQPALMTVFRNEGRWDTSNVELRDGKIVAYSKQERTPAMRHIDYGLTLLSPEALADVPDGTPCDLEPVFQRLLRRGELAAYEVSQRFYEIGSLSGLEELRHALMTPGTLPTGSRP